MINLIPREAKKRIIIEYWVRVASVWFFSITAALVAGICILVPTYVLISLQIHATEGSSKAASEKVAGYEAATKELTKANQKAQILVGNNSYTPTTDYLRLISAHEGKGVMVSQVSLVRVKDGFGPITVSGQADNRQALREFRDSLLGEPTVAAVDLPISNLAKDRDIQFSLTVTVKKTDS